MPTEDMILFRLDKSEKEIKKLEEKIDLLLENSNKLKGVFSEMERNNYFDKIQKLEIETAALKIDRDWLKKLQFMFLGAMISGVGGLVMGVISLFLKK